MTYEQAKKLKIGDKIRLKPNKLWTEGKVITITDIKEEIKNDKPVLWFADENGAWHWHKQHKPLADKEQ